MNLVVLAGAAIVFTAIPPSASPEPVIPMPQQQYAPGEMPVLNPNAPVGKACPPTSRTEAARRGGRLGIQHLNELPAADMYVAVDRRVEGCMAPIITRFDIGGGR